LVSARLVLSAAGRHSGLGPGSRGGGAARVAGEVFAGGR
jgi:hypothetical protein